MPACSLRGLWFNLRGGQRRARHAALHAVRPRRHIPIPVPILGLGARAEGNPPSSQPISFPLAKHFPPVVGWGFLINGLPCWDFGDYSLWGALAEETMLPLVPWDFHAVHGGLRACILPAAHGIRDGDKDISQLGL